MMRSVKRDILKKNQNIDTEVVIIGAGIMGLSTAYYLVTKGVKNICLLYFAIWCCFSKQTRL